MLCEDKDCKYKTINYGDCEHDHYFCGYCKITIRDDEECFLDKRDMEENK